MGMRGRWFITIKRVFSPTPRTRNSARGRGLHVGSARMRGPLLRRRRRMELRGDGCRESSSSLVIYCQWRAFRGFSQCALSTISVHQSATGQRVNGKPEYEVAVSNHCVCMQYDVLLSCTGFKTTMPVAPTILQEVAAGGACLLNTGNPLLPEKPPIKFRYAWDSQFSFRPISSGIACS